jgi:glycosyltransferase involved in cell wall biosynthesis
MQIILLDDRSTDATAAQARSAIAARPSANHAIMLTGEPLPAGWAGKLWAQQQGIAQAVQRQPDTQFFFFGDADIVHTPDTLRALVAKAETHRRDLVSLMVRLNCRSLWEKLLIPAFIFFFQKLYPFAWIADPRRRTAGGRVLIRRAMLSDRRLAACAAH